MLRRFCSHRGCGRRLKFELLEDRRLLATVTVGNLSDVIDGDVSSIAALIGTPGADGVSLREAMLAANADAAADTIDFAVTGTIQLTNIGHTGELAITNSLTIDGPGASLLTIRAFAGTTSSGDGSRIFRVDDGAATLKDVFIDDLTLTGGDRTLATDGADGGAILNSENLTLTGCTVSGNRATSGNGRGGGVFSQLGSLTMVATTISGNNSARGGGIYASGAGMAIRDSAIRGNSANGSGTFGGGGGIVLANAAGSLSTITNSTISGNFTSSANGGGILNASAGSVTISHCTITLNRVNSGSGGGVHNNVATASLDHTIVAGNLKLATSLESSDLTGSATAVRYSLIGVNTGSTITDNGGNQIGTAASPIDALLAPLAENGGPALTHALLAGSPAIDAGDPTAVAGVGSIPLHDQRDSVFTRVADGDGAGGARIDIGAYERQALPGLSLVVDTLADENDHDYSAGDLSLREAINLANGSIGADTISFAAALTAGGPATIQLLQGELVIGESLAIGGPGAGRLTISAYDPTPAMKNGDGSRVFNVDDRNTNNASSVEISGVKLTGGDTNGSGGAVFANDNLVLSDSIITGNASGIPTAVQGGGGIYSGDGGNLTVIRCTIASNSAAAEGGGIRKIGGQLVIEDSQIENNVAGWVGGGVSASDGGVNVMITRTSVKSNASSASSSYGGGGLFFYYATAMIRDSLISGNTSLYRGGGVDATVTTLSIIGTTVSGNTAASNGGGVRSNGGSWEIAFSTITANTAPAGMGSGAWVSSGTAARIFRSSIVAGNTNSDVDGDVTVFQSSGFNLIGTGNAVGAFNQLGDQTGVINPSLDSLADNGGPTMTHALLPGSPALDAGDPAAVAGVGGVPSYDQRGAPFDRIAGGRIDIGAVERQPIPATFFGDYNQNGVVDAADYVLWRKTRDMSVPPYSGADGSGNGAVGQEDLGIWRSHFGQTVSSGASATSAASMEGRVAISMSEVGRAERGIKLLARARAAVAGDSPLDDGLISWLKSLAHARRDSELGEALSDPANHGDDASENAVDEARESAWASFDVL